MDRKTTENIVTLFLCTTIIVFFCTELILNLTPPISRDALIHHLAIPKLWLAHGGFYEIPWAPYAYYPMNINLLYSICLYFNNDIAPKFIHLAFGLGTGLLIYLYLKPKYSRNWGLLGVVIFISTPIVVWLSTTAYIDLGMTFFTTASVMAFIKWRDNEYTDIKWLLLSCLLMGIAVGSKYNALIAWFLMNMILVLSVAHDTRRQSAALWYGILFCVVTAFVASPWYLKNYLQTGNPFYPLFNNFFNSLHQHSVQEALQRQAIEKTGQISFFKLREVMYGENFWETLLIPIRMFFQGKDTSYQYFQGSLNPILILFSPFVLLNKRHGKDKFLFISFTVIFMIITFFLTAKQVRYILPVLPFLTILAVMGLKDFLDKMEEGRLKFPLISGKNIKSIARFIIFPIVIILLIFNLFYLKERMNVIKPFPYLSCRETRDAFLTRHLLHYDAVKYINDNLPTNAKVFTMFIGRRGYYLDRTYENDALFGMSAIRHMVDSSKDENKFKDFLISMDITHILMRTELVYNYLKDNFSIEEINRFMTLVRKYWELLYEYNGYSVWDIRQKLEK
jgi:hypothetical protein